MNKNIQEKIIKDIGENRFKHSLRVKDTAIKLAKKNNIDTRKVELAAIFHDCAKIPNKDQLLKKANDFNLTLDEYMKENHELIHAHLGAVMAEKLYGINDVEILNAIKYHTTGRENMNMLEKIIYMADYIEPNRNFPGVEEIREMAFKDINKSLLMAIDRTIIFLIQNKKLLQLDTIKLRNKLIFK